MRRAALAVWVVAAAASCRACACAESAPAPKEATPAPVAATAPDPFAPVPPRVAQAMALRANEPHRALELLEEAWAEAVDAGDVRTAGMALHRSGDLSNDLLEFRAAHTFYVRALGFYELGGESKLLGTLTNDLGLLSRVSGDDPLRWFSYSVDARRDAGDVRGLRISLGNLGARMVLGKRYLESMPVLDEALALAQAAGDLEAQRKAHLNLASAWLLAAEDGSAAAWSSDAGLGPRSNAFNHLRAAQELGARLGLDAYRAACEGLMVEARSMCTELGGPQSENPGADEDEEEDGG